LDKAIGISFTEVPKNEREIEEAFKEGDRGYVRLAMLVYLLVSMWIKRGGLPPITGLCLEDEE